MPQYRQDVSQESHSGNQSFSKNWSAEADNESIVTAPGSKKSIFLSDAIVSNGDTAGYVQFLQNPTDSTSSTIINRLNLAINALAKINNTQPLLLTPNAALVVDSTTADDFSVTVNYYIDEVKGFGYASGGWTGTAALSSVQENFFASDSSSTVGADLALAGSSFPNVYGAAGASSATHGYLAGGNTGTIYNRAQISKFSFSSTANATYNGDLFTTQRYNTGFFSISNGYSSGGYSNVNLNQISSYSFSSDANSTLVGELTTALYAAAGQQSSTNGYTSGGYSTEALTSIEKFSFASEGLAPSVGDLTVARSHVCGQSSVEKGYSCGGVDSPSYYNTVDSFSFASDGNAVDNGDLTVARSGSSGQSSTVSGYTSGGTPASDSWSKVIDKFNFAFSGNSASVGDLVTACTHTVGQQSN